MIQKQNLKIFDGGASQRFVSEQYVWLLTKSLFWPLVFKNHFIELTEILV